MGLCGVASADQEVGKVVAVRGKASIERGKAKLDAKVRDGIQASDIIKTAANSRAKLLFIDDSVLTLSDNSTLAVTEFIKGKAGERGTSVFNLLDGKMRSVVGRTKFEVKTPSAVAAARGTVIFFDVSLLRNVPVSKIICLEGTVQVRSTSPTIPGSVLLTPGRMVTFTSGGTSLPRSVPAPPAELRKARSETSAANLPEDKSKSDKQASTSSTTGSSTNSTTTGTTDSSSNTANSSSSSTSSSTTSGSTSSAPISTTSDSGSTTSATSTSSSSTPSSQSSAAGGGSAGDIGSSTTSPTNNALNSTSNTTSTIATSPSNNATPVAVVTPTDTSPTTPTVVARVDVPTTSSSVTTPAVVMTTPPPTITAPVVIIVTIPPPPPPPPPPLPTHVKVNVTIPTGH